MSRRYLPLAVDTVEDIEGYKPGGYHPVHLGDTFDGRYKILHKLGSGGFSTTWLARDTVGKRYYALKIVKAAETAASTELRTLEKLAAIQSDDCGRHHIRNLAAYFTFQGPNGLHNCLVTEVAGPSLNRLYNVIGHGYAQGSRRLRADIARTATRQLVQAVHFLHSQRICHGDLTLSNVLLKLKSIDDWTEDEVLERLGTPSTQDLVAAPGTHPGDSAPRYVVEPASMPDAKYFTHDVLLVDFGEAFPVDSPPRPEDIGIPVKYRAPETFFESKVSPASEAWSLACVLYEIRAGDPLFTSIMGGRDEIIMQMVQMKGKLLGPWWSSWDGRSMFVDDDDEPLKERTNVAPRAQEYPLEGMIAEIGGEDEEEAFFGSEVSILEPKDTKVPPDEADSMRDFLEGALRWAPEERLSVAQMLRHPWIAG
ncbi:hypothetical protein LTR02_012771 [Friedmanniomyces endolithicus]|nr:hypothetical protein LTR94_019131 [Friedmanniomyces endolithicus]KAK0769484.1 hypothetical protein LTR59_017004 [Friedmanniomyces endolithicus]KAK0786160.1 hypothetical protein LTR38_012112 [Friedmanniomyces endolithicus]KAK0790117.1 hypothetical protein LTR75_012138 [Friedmanniomyces endolithicus]KAK0854404.1 hypothetical protein LTR03_002435 [Friedmanniomyces endolithicus]